MRKAFVSALLELARADPRVLLLTADLGYTVLEPFAQAFPDRFFNVGVAEQNMVGMATGLAEAGFTPFLYNIASFAALRPYEFFVNGPIAHRLPVRLIGVGGGFDYGAAGATHHGTSDLGIMRLQPHLVVIAPADHAQAHAAFLRSREVPGPIYFRLGKNDTATVPGLDGRFDPAHLDVVRRGSDLVFITCGAIAVEVTAAAEELASCGIHCTVAVVSCLRPSPTTDLVGLLGEFSHAVTVEAHYVSGGLGSLVAEIIAEHGLSCRLVRRGIEAPSPNTGSEAYLQRLHGLSRSSLTELARAIVIHA